MVGTLLLVVGTAADDCLVHVYGYCSVAHKATITIDGEQVCQSKSNCSADRYISEGSHTVKNLCEGAHTAVDRDVYVQYKYDGQASISSIGKYNGSGSVTINFKCPQGAENVSEN